MDYGNFEVLVLDNNTKDEALWKPLEKRCAELGPRFRFFHLDNWPGFKAGALNFGLKQTDPRAEVVGVVDADYVVSPDWLSCLIPHFDAADVAVVQAPQAHRDWETQPFRRMCNWEFDGFFRIGMHHRNERNALIQHGTMTLVRRIALEEVGGWSEWCICEDTELGLRLIEKGYDTRYVDHILGRGLTPADFPAIKSQRFRWAFGAMQILKHTYPRCSARAGSTSRSATTSSPDGSLGSGTRCSSCSCSRPRMDDRMLYMPKSSGCRCRRSRCRSSCSWHSRAVPGRSSTQPDDGRAVEGHSRRIGAPVGWRTRSRGASSPA